MKHVSASSRPLLFDEIPFSALFDVSLVFERKFEIHSLAGYLSLFNEYFIYSQNFHLVDVKWLESY
jgi:meiotically up-regulated gene 157 (Mug157) protein